MEAGKSKWFLGHQVTMSPYSPGIMGPKIVQEFGMWLVLLPKKLTTRPWKMMVGRQFILSFGNGPFFKGTFVNFRGVILYMIKITLHDLHSATDLFWWMLKLVVVEHVPLRCGCGTTIAKLLKSIIMIRRGWDWPFLRVFEKHRSTNIASLRFVHRFWIVSC